MYKQYFKQALQSIKENPLVSTISIAGTALSIAMIMVVVMIFQIKSANYAPEDKRDRMLYISGTQVVSKDEKNRNRGNMSAEAIRECFYSLEIPEAATGFSTTTKPISLPGKRLFNSYSIKYTDPGFWTVFDFSFVKGTPFSKEDFSSGIASAVISETLAKEVFGTIDAVGKTCILDFTEYTIKGVAKPVTKAAQDAYADMWVPYTSKSSLIQPHTPTENMYGPFSVCLLASQRSDFNKIREELKRRTAAYNAGKKDNYIDFMDNPLNKINIAMGSDGFNKKPLKDFLLQTGSILLFLLFVPALNLTGVIQSSVQKRQAEIGVRKAFGATSGRILTQVLWENLVITLIGMLIGTVLSFIFLNIGKNFLLSEGTDLTVNML